MLEMLNGYPRFNLYKTVIYPHNPAAGGGKRWHGKAPRRQMVWKLLDIAL
nr:hypothetical protein [uncultured Duganella sp.]